MLAPNKESYRIMGIDPGTNYMGYGVVEVTGRELRSVVMGAIDLHKLTDPYAKLRRIFDRVGALVDEYAPREVALESPFFGENVQSMLKLGRAQGVAMAAALCRDVPVFEYAPSRIKQCITGGGAAAKEQVAALVTRILGIDYTPRSSTRPTAWPWRCAITSCRAARSTPHWATNATRGWAAAARPRRRAAANRGKNSSKRTPTANSNVDPVPPRRPSRTVSRPRIRLSQPTRFQAVVRPLHPLSERFPRRSAILITFRNFQTKFSYELQFYRINSNHCVTNLKKLKKNS